MQLLPEQRYSIVSPHTVEEAMAALGRKTVPVRDRRDRSPAPTGKLFEGVVGETGFQLRHATPTSKLGTPVLKGVVDGTEGGCSILVTPSFSSQDKMLIFGSMAFLALWAGIGILLGGPVVLLPAAVFAAFFIFIFRQIHQEAAAMKAELTGIFGGHND